MRVNSFKLARGKRREGVCTKSRINNLLLLKTNPTVIMKKTNIITATAILFAAITPAIGTAANKEGADSASMSSKYTSQSVTRISEDRVDNLTTAKDLIGSSVYDSAGEKIGDISDISFGRNLMSTAMPMSDKSKDWSAKDKMSKEKNYEDTGAMSNNSSHRDVDGNRPESIVFISVGGLFGIGDDLVQVSASQLRYDTKSEHYILNGVTKDQVAKIADQDESEFNEDNYYADSWYDSRGMKSSSDWGDKTDTNRAKRDFNSDASLVKESFSGMKDFSSVTVSKSGDKIVLSGSVSSKSLRNKAEKLAKESTDLSVENNIRVSGE